MEQNGWQTASVSTPLPIYTITVSHWTSHKLKFFSIYQLVLDFLSRQSLPIAFAIRINLVHLDGLPSATLWDKHKIPHLCPKFLLISHSASFCSSISKPIFSMCILSFLSFLLLSILATIFPVCVTKLTVRLSLYFATFVFFYKTITVTLGHCLFHLCYWSVLSLLSDHFLHFTLQNIKAIIVCIYLLFKFDFWFSVPLD